MLLASSCHGTRQTQRGRPWHCSGCLPVAQSTSLSCGLISVFLIVAYRNTLVCDTMAEGKQLSWGQGPERHKVATLDGTLFAKAGSITGGMAGNLAGRAQRWGDKEYETLKKVECLV